MSIDFMIKKNGAEMHMGYSDMFNFRLMLARVYDKQMNCGGQLGLLYKTQLDGMGIGVPDGFWENYYETLDVLAEKFHLNKKVLDFLHQPDCEGEITYGTAGLIYKIMSDYNSRFVVFKEYSYPMNNKFAWQDNRNENDMDWENIAVFFLVAWEFQSKIIWC